MRSNQELARRRLDERLGRIGSVADVQRPPRGWIRAIREALGMSTTELAERMGLSQSRVVRIEQSEVEGRLNMETLERAADALGCRLFYALVPEIPLQEKVRHRAREKAAEQIADVNQTMLLEGQGLDDRVLDEHVDELADELMDRRGLWSAHG